MLIKIYKEENGIPVLAGQFQQKVKDDRFGTLCNLLTEKCQEVYGCSDAVFPGLCLYSTAGGKSTFRVKKGEDMSCSKRNETILTGQLAPRDICNMTDIVYKKGGCEVTEKFGAEFIAEGFVIATGKEECCGLYGIQKPTFLKSIGKTQVKRGIRQSAKVFSTAQAALAYIRKHEQTFRMLAGSYGWCPELRFVSEEYKDFLLEGMTEKKKKNMQNAMEEANRLFEACCSQPIKHQDEKYGESLKEEALIRMKQLSLWGVVIRNFKAGKLMLSEFGGILYDLDEDAKAAVKAVEERGDLPYHVVKTGNAYSVLYVSPNRNDWKYERYNPATGHIDAFVKNGWIEEHGAIIVCPCNGGLKRIAV